MTEFWHLSLHRKAPKSLTWDSCSLWLAVIFGCSTTCFFPSKKKKIIYTCISWFSLLQCSFSELSEGCSHLQSSIRSLDKISLTPFKCAFSLQPVGHSGVLVQSLIRVLFVLYSPCVCFTIITMWYSVKQGHLGWNPWSFGSEPSRGLNLWKLEG